MIEPIIRLCIKDYENTADKKVREKYSILGGLLGIFCNLFLFASKFAVGMMSNSIAILSDAFNNLTDMGSSAISIISAKLSNRPPDKDHPFGHGRFEYLASLTIGIIILVVGYKLCETSIAKFFAPEPMEISYWSIGVLILSIAVKGWMYCYNRYIGKKSTPASTKPRQPTASTTPSPRQASWSRRLPSNLRPCPSTPPPGRSSAS